jgi:hypothetical protein
MRTALDVLGYSIAGARGLALPPARTVAFGPPGAHPRQARLPGVAVAMATRALPPSRANGELSVFFGTALGCLTETQAFLENLILRGEATPMPRAFSMSVHNAVASQIALALKAHGESQTFVHADVAFAQALFAAARHHVREAQGTSLVGGADEYTLHAGEARAALGWRKEEETSEGGAVLAFGAPTPETPVLARVTHVRLGRPSHADEWLAAELTASPVDAVLLAYAAGSPARATELVARTPVIDVRALTGDHPSSLAASTALAVAVLASELDAHALALPEQPHTLALGAVSRHGDAAFIVLERAT